MIELERFYDKQVTLSDGTKIKLYKTDKAALYSIDCEDDKAPSHHPFACLQGYSLIGGPEWSDIVEACNG